MTPAAASRCRTANASSGVGCCGGSRCTRIPAPASTRAASSANRSLPLRASRPMTTPACALAGLRSVSQPASAAVVARTMAPFIRFGPAATAPRSPAVPNSSRPANRSASSAEADVSPASAAASSARSSAWSGSSGSSATQAVTRARSSPVRTSPLTTHHLRPARAGSRPAGFPSEVPPAGRLRQPRRGRAAGRPAQPRGW